MFLAARFGQGDLLYPLAEAFAVGIRVIGQTAVAAYPPVLELGGRSLSASVIGRRQAWQLE